MWLWKVTDTCQIQMADIYITSNDLVCPLCDLWGKCYCEISWKVFMLTSDRFVSSFEGPDWFTGLCIDMWCFLCCTLHKSERVKYLCLHCTSDSCRVWSHVSARHQWCLKARSPNRLSEKSSLARKKGEQDECEARWREDEGGGILQMY